MNAHEGDTSFASVRTPFKKILNPGAVIINGRRADVFVSVTYDEKGKLSLTGVEGPLRNGDALGSCGQIDMGFKLDEYARHWTADRVERLLYIWHRWHLNDMRAGCEHQREWDTTRPLELQKLTWGPAFHEMRRKVEQGEATDAEYRDYAVRIRPLVESLTLGLIPPKHPATWGSRGEAALAEELVKIANDQRKAASWVYPEEHPDGLLMKPCSTCGYRYGSKWLFEPVPLEVLAELQAMPESEKTPAWV